MRGRSVRAPPVAPRRACRCERSPSVTSDLRSPAGPKRPCWRVDKRAPGCGVANRFRWGGPCRHRRRALPKRLLVGIARSSCPPASCGPGYWLVGRPAGRSPGGTSWPRSSPSWSSPHPRFAFLRTAQRSSSVEPALGDRVGVSDESSSVICGPLLARPGPSVARPSAHGRGSPRCGTAFRASSSPRSPPDYCQPPGAVRARSADEPVACRSWPSSGFKGTGEVETWRRGPATRGVSLLIPR